MHVSDTSGLEFSPPYHCSDVFQEDSWLTVGSGNWRCCNQPTEPSSGQLRQKRSLLKGYWITYWNARKIREPGLANRQKQGRTTAKTSTHSHHHLTLLFCRSNSRIQIWGGCVCLSQPRFQGSWETGLGVFRFYGRMGYPGEIDPWASAFLKIMCIYLFLNCLKWLF